MSTHFHFWALTSVMLSIGSAHICYASQKSVPTVAGPEHAELDSRLEGYVMMDRPVGGLVAIALETLEETVLREPGKASGVVHSVSGPDSQGRVAFVENHMVAKRHLLKTITVDGKAEKTLFEREGDALWSHNGDEIGDYLALAPRGGLVAFVENLEGVQMEEPKAYLHRGELAVWSVETGAELPIEAQALDCQLHWFPDGKRLAYSDLVPREEALQMLKPNVGVDLALASDFLGWERLPVVFVYDVEAGTAVALHVGTQPAVSGDARTVFIRGFNTRWRTYDIEDGSSIPLEAPGGIWPGAIGFVDASLLLYWARPTEGLEPGWTRNNSPLVGPKPMRTLKVVDLATGQFRTAIPSLDPRRRVSFGTGKD